MLPIEVDLNNIFTKQDLFDRFNQVFGFPEYFWNNWDAFNDVMGALDSDSNFVQKHDPLPTWIHIILLNFDLFHLNFNKDDLIIFMQIFFFLSSNKVYRYDNMSFTFEYRYNKNYNGYINSD